jgi:hypothetical protein
MSIFRFRKEESEDVEQGAGKEVEVMSRSGEDRVRRIMIEKTTKEEKKTEPRQAGHRHRSLGARDVG